MPDPTTAFHLKQTHGARDAGSGDRRRAAFGITCKLVPLDAESVPRAGIDVRWDAEVSTSRGSVRDEEGIDEH
jgi:hypothetical protein